jgi:lysophospholipid acyltransferase (LPLAT)-like uncharacterized protein
VPSSPSKSPHRYTFTQQAALWLVPRLAALVIAAIGVTLRFENVVEEGAAVQTPPNSGIWCFWHQCTFAAGWHYRPFHPHVLISRSFDGELVARTLELLGYQTVRGSSSRGAVAGLLGLRTVVEQGTPVVFTADGPRGPIYVTKLGPVKLAQMTGYPIGSFHLQPERAWTLGSWDRFMIPRPFSRVVVAWSRPVPAPAPEASETELELSRQALNAALERARLSATEQAARPRHKA